MARTARRIKQGETYRFRRISPLAALPAERSVAKTFLSTSEARGSILSSRDPSGAISNYFGFVGPRS